MTESQDTSQRRMKWLRRAARIFGPLWAVCFALYAPGAGLMAAGLWSLGTGGYMDPEMQRWAVDVGNAIVVGGFALAVAPLVSVGIAFRWERIGGVLLLFQGFVLLAAGVFLQPVLQYGGFRVAAFPLAAGILFLAAGILFLASWRESRALEPPQATE